MTPEIYPGTPWRDPKPRSGNQSDVFIDFYIKHATLTGKFPVLYSQGQIGVTKLSNQPRVFFLKVFHEDSIISGYRHPRSSATDCILSLFQLTNETLNIWTHFLPTWYSWQILFSLQCIPILRFINVCLLPYMCLADWQHLRAVKFSCLEASCLIRWGHSSATK